MFCFRLICIYLSFILYIYILLYHLSWLAQVVYNGNLNFFAMVTLNFDFTACTYRVEKRLCMTCILCYFLLFPLFFAFLFIPFDVYIMYTAGQVIPNIEVSSFSGGEGDRLSDGSYIFWGGTLIFGIFLLLVLEVREMWVKHESSTQMWLSI